MKKNKKNLKAVSLIIVIALMLFFIPKVYKRMRVLKGISGKEELMFSASLNNNRGSTYKYEILKGGMRRISHYWFNDLHYSDDHKRIIGCVRTDDFFRFC